jgi:hypothetical protein
MNYLNHFDEIESDELPDSDDETVDESVDSKDSDHETFVKFMRSFLTEEFDDDDDDDDDEEFNPFEKKCEVKYTGHLNSKNLPLRDSSTKFNCRSYHNNLRDGSFSTSNNTLINEVQNICNKMEIPSTDYENIGTQDLLSSENLNLNMTSVDGIDEDDEFSDGGIDMNDDDGDDYDDDDNWDGVGVDDDGDDNDEFDEDDDDCSDDDLVKVAKWELQELIDDCWQTITGEEPHLPNAQKSQESASEKSHINMNACDNINDSNLSSINRIDADRPSITGAANYSNRNSRHVLVSKIINQIFSGEIDPSEACIDGMPLNAIRRLVSRQMSMAFQLLLQMLLLSDESSNVFTKCYSCLMELMKQRGPSTKKALLLQTNVECAKLAYKHSMSRFANKLGKKAPSNIIKADDEPVSRRITRRLSTRDNSESLSSSQSFIGKKQCLSVFDMPCLNHTPTLFELIDKARKESYQTIRRYASFPSSVSMENTTQSRYSLMLSILRQQVSSINTVIEMKSWLCLIPTSSYPLDETSLDTVHAIVDSSSSTNIVTDIMNHLKSETNSVLRYNTPSIIQSMENSQTDEIAFFTPAEDDLLLRGYITYGCKEPWKGNENKQNSTGSSIRDLRWNKIHDQCLPNKTEESLKKRYEELTSISRIDDNKFKQYVVMTLF